MSTPAASRDLRHTVERNVLRVLRWVVIIGAIVFTAGPLLYTVLLSIRPLSSIVNEPLQFIPSLSEIDFGSYVRALSGEASNGFGLGRFMGNSLFVALGTTVLSVAFSALGAYAAVRLRFLGRDTVNGFFLAIYVLPGIVLAVPLFVMFSYIGLKGTLPGLVIIYLAQTIPLSLYMLRNYFQAVPVSVEEAAMIDGCGRLGMIRRVVLPIAVPGLAATGLYVFMIAWNEFLFALLFLVQDRDRWTVSLGLAQFSDVGVPVTVLMAGSIAITLPIVVLFFAAERMLVSGLTAGAEKG
ncbi:MAG: ABC transporter permease subunit [Streptosporangiales bacterium]|nr:ABC transporter permease subunit [Streptosporangiales bacterium]